jgi:subtilisin family serine protease
VALATRAAAILATRTVVALATVLLVLACVSGREPAIAGATSTPNDPLLPEQWALAKVSAPAAWQISSGSSDVVIAVLDSGVDYTHPDLAANMWHNPGEIAANGLDDDNNGYVDDIYGIDAADGDSDPMDLFGHGTAVAGVAAAVGDDGQGMCGVAWHARIMALRFLPSADGGGDVLAPYVGHTADAVECIDYAIAEKTQHGVNVVAINASWGGLASSQPLRDAIARAADAGIVFCAAAGNHGANNDAFVPVYPASYDGTSIIAVAASTADDELAAFSCYGPQSVDLAAPGQSVLTTSPGGGYATGSGTSLATPHVTGALALLAAAYPGESASDRVHAILAGSQPLPDLEGKCTSEGRLDLRCALDRSAPSVSLAGDASGRWRRTKATLTVSAEDDASGVATVEYRIGGGGWTAYSAPIVVSAEGETTMSYRAVDNAGNTEAAKDTTVRIDKSGPVTAALSNVTAARGQPGVFRFRVADRTPLAAALIRVFRNGQRVKTLWVGTVSTGKTHAHRWRCSLLRGRYTWKVYATDEAGNAQVKIGSKTLTVK